MKATQSAARRTVTLQNRCVWLRVITSAGTESVALQESNEPRLYLISIIRSEGNFMPPRAYIARDYRFGPDVQTDRGLLIAPSPWEETKGLKQ